MLLKPKLSETDEYKKINIKDSDTFFFKNMNNKNILSPQ